MADSTDNNYSRWNVAFSYAQNPFLYYICELHSDVTLIVGADKKRIPGHKFILSQSSWEFFNVFNNIKLDKDELLIEDVTEEIFLCFLKFCYTKKLELNGIDGFAVLKLAYRFQAKTLIEICETHLLKLIKRNNCLEFLTKNSFINQDSKLKVKILKLIEVSLKWLTCEKNQKRIFNNLPLEALKEIVDLEYLNCDEMQIFNGIINWTKFNCEKKNISSEPENLRLILRDVFYKIRFPTMKSDWFIEILSEYSNIFTGEEISDITKDIKSKEKTNLKFSKNLRKRCKLVRDPFTLDWGITGNRIQCFPGSFNLCNDSSSEMSIKFGCCGRYNTRVLLGFAFISKRGQNKKIITCQLKKGDGSYLCQIHEMETEVKHNWTLYWDYCLPIVVFKHKFELLRDEWYQSYQWCNLYCNLDCDMVNVKLDPPFPTDHFASEGICIRKGEYNIIPYLIFE